MGEVRSITCTCCGRASNYRLIRGTGCPAFYACCHCDGFDSSRLDYERPAPPPEHGNLILRFLRHVRSSMGL